MSHIITRSARRATRLVYGGEKHLRDLKVAAHRRNRRAVRQAISAGRADLAGVERRVTKLDVC